MKIIQKFLTPNKFSRPQKKLEKVKRVIVHWVGNAGSTALGNWTYFENLKTGKTYKTKTGNAYLYASSHYIIGLDGEVIQCIPENEWAYCSNSANKDSIGIENTHLDWSGKFTDATYNSLIELCADICKRHNLNPLTDLQMHFHITGKICPKYFVEHIEEWNIFKTKVADLLKPQETELEKALKILSTKKIEGFNDTIINSKDYWMNAIKKGEINPEFTRLLLIKVSKYLENL